MSLKTLLNAPRPNTRADIGPVVAAVVAARRAVTDFHDTLLAAQSAETPDTARAMEQAQQTAAALVREINTLLEQARKVQSVDDQLTGVLAALKASA